MKMHFNGNFFIESTLEYTPEKIMDDLNIIIEEYNSNNEMPTLKSSYKMLYEGPLFKTTIKYEKDNNIAPDKRVLNL